MSAQITVNVAGSERSVPEQTTAADLFPEDRAVLVARVNGELRDLAHVLADGDVRRAGAGRRAGRPGRAAPLRRPRARPGGAGGAPQGPARHRPAGPGRLLLRLRRRGAVQPRRPQGAREGHAAHRQRGPDLRAPRDHRRRGARRAGGRALQVRADRPQGRLGRDRRRGRLRRGGRRPADHLRQRPPRRQPRLGRPVPRPARALHQGARQRLQADAQRGGLLARARRRTRSCSASTAPPGRPRTTSRPTSTGWPRPRSATTASSAPSSTCSASPTSSAPGWRCSTPRAGSSSARWRTTSAGGTSRRASSTSAPRTSPRSGLFHTSGHLPYYADTMFPPMEIEGTEYRLKAMNCPMHNLIFRSRGRSYRELPLRLFEFGVGLPLREVRRRARPDPRARADPGRLALLRHRRAGAGRDQAPADFVLGLLRDFGLDDYYLELSTRERDKDKFIGSDEQWEDGHRGPRARWRPSPGSSSSPTRAAPPTTARRSRCRRATPSAAPGRCRPSSTTSTSRRGSGWSTRRPTARASSR